MDIPTSLYNQSLREFNGSKTFGLFVCEDSFYEKRSYFIAEKAALQASDWRHSYNNSNDNNNSF